MNRKKAILFISGIQSVLLGMLIVLLATGTIRPVTFAAIVIIVGLVASALIFVAIRKFPPL